MQEFPPFRLDPLNQCLWCRRAPAADERIPLPPKAFAVLHYLVVHAGRLVTQEELLEAVWPETYVQPEVLRNHIFDIRRALGDSPQAPQFVETLPRRGYRFIAAVRDSAGVEPAGPPAAAPALLVGRERALGALRWYLQHAVRGQRQLVLITGEPGSGKTALVDAFQRQAVREEPLGETMPPDNVACALPSAGRHFDHIAAFGRGISHGGQLLVARIVNRTVLVNLGGMRRRRHQTRMNHAFDQQAHRDRAMHLHAIHFRRFAVFFQNPDGLEDFVLRCEVVIEQAVRNAGLRCNVADA